MNKFIVPFSVLVLVGAFQAQAASKFLCYDFPVYKQYELRIDLRNKTANIDTVVYSSDLKLTRASQTETVRPQKIYVFEGNHNGPEKGTWKVFFNEHLAQATLSYMKRTGNLVQVGTSSCKTF
jgi:hypothetical protein